jgi:hypothetical protein
MINVALALLWDEFNRFLKKLRENEMQWLFIALLIF